MKDFNILLTICLILIFSCKVENSDYERINLESSIDIQINDYKLLRGIVMMNNYYTLSTGCPLIYEEQYPKWIVDKDSISFKLPNYRFNPTIKSIDPPFRLKKEKGEDVFYVIKNDTLKFQLVDYK